MAENTIFDDVFRTMIEKMPELAILLINEVFGTEYLHDAEIRQGRNEHTNPDRKTITDSYIMIEEYLEKKRYNMVSRSIGRIKGQIAAVA